MAFEFIGAFESTYMPEHDLDVMEVSRHDLRWRSDLALLKDCGVSRLRYPLRWHRIEATPRAYDWSLTDQVLGYMHGEGFVPIVDLVHHTSYPRWLTGGFADPQFASSYLRFCEEFACRYPWITQYTLFNEPFATLFLCGHEAIWAPYGSGMSSFVLLLRNVLPALFEATRMFKDLLPAALHVYVDTCEGHSGAGGDDDGFARVANDRRFFVVDLLLGKDVGPERPFMQKVIEAGGEDLLWLEPGHLDVFGLDYYAHSEWHFPVGSPDEVVAICPSPRPVGLAALIGEYWERYRLPMILSETNIRGYSTDRASWLKYTLEQCELAHAAGADLDAYCWFPFVDSTDWDSLLAYADRHIDPVGVYWLDEDLERRTSLMLDSYCLAASGAPSSMLPAYRFQPPLDTWLAGLLPQMAHWEWVDPRQDELGGDRETRCCRSPRELADESA